MLVEFECPECKGHACETWALNTSNSLVRLSLWHWVINPALAVNEVLLGQRIPARMFVCKSCEVSMPDRCYVHCSGCDRFHQSRLWSGANALGHWLGYFCPDCGANIPCLRNWTTTGFLYICSPLRLLTGKAVERRLISFSRKRIGGPSAKRARPALLTGTDYKKAGWAYALGMNLVMSVGLSLLWMQETGDPFSIPFFLTMLVVGAAIWLPAGWLYAFVIKKLLSTRGDRSMLLTTEHLKVVSPSSSDTE